MYYVMYYVLLKRGKNHINNLTRQSLLDGFIK